MLKRRRKRLYYTDSRARIRLFLPCCNISYNVDCLSNYLLNSSVPKNIQKLFNRSSSIYKYNTRSSATGNYYVSESRISLQIKSFVNFGTRLSNSLHPDWRALKKGPFKKRIRKFLLTVLGIEDANVDAYSLVTKLNNH